MSADRPDDWVNGLREEYNRPGDTPREEMWAAIEARLGALDDPIVALEEARAARAAFPRRAIGWAVAAAALAVLGIGVGRATAPGSGRATDTVAAPDAPGTPGADAPALRVASLRHLGRMESLLAMVRADGRSGLVDPQVGPWASGLLAETRLLLDRTGPGDPPMRNLLEDLELVLVQIVGASELGDVDEARASAEISLTLECIEQREVLPRIRALMPAGPVLSGA